MDLKIYEVSLKEHDYDEYDGWVVIAENEEEVKELCGIKKEPEKDRWQENLFEDNIDYIKEIGNAHSNMEKGIVLGSYNAG